MSLRLRITLIVTTVFVFFGVVASYVSVRQLRLDIDAAMDERLQSTAGMMQNILATMPVALARDYFAEISTANDKGTSKGLSCQISSLNGEILARSNSNYLPQSAVRKTGFARVSENDVVWRSYTLNTPEYRVTIADKLSDREALYSQLLITTLVPPVLALVTSLLLIWFAIGRGLLPLRQLSNLLKNREANDFSPVVLTKPGPELSPLIESQNALLSRLAETLEREKSFADNAAHELRTPVAGIISQLQVAKVAEGTVLAKALMHSESSAHRLGKLIDDLLFLARVDSDTCFKAMEPWCLKPTVDKVLAEFGADAHAVECQIEATDLIAFIPEFAVEVVCRNLIDNALKYRAGEDPVGCYIRAQQNVLQIEVSNCGAVPQDQINKMTQRFWRNSSKPGSGLGLAMVEAIIRRFNGIWEMQNRENSLFVSRVTFKAQRLVTE